MLHQLFLLGAFFLAHLSLVHSFSFTMTWAQTWNNILEGGPKRWKVDNLAFKQRALQRILEQHFGTLSTAASTAADNNKSPQLSILCPLAGDDPFVQYAWSQGHNVTAIDLVPAAVDVMRQQFGGLDADWTKQEEDGQSSSSNTIIWKHSSGRATLYAGDMMQKRPELNAKFDAVYDKDAFGALPLELRQPYCQRLADYCKPEATVYSEVKLKAGGKEAGGPPFHVEKEDLMETTSFGANFHHVEALGEVYDVEIPGASQTAHIMKRK